MYAKSSPNTTSSDTLSATLRPATSWYEQDEDRDLKALKEVASLDEV